MNAQELFLDVSSGRFLDGESTIAANKPSFFSDEQRRIKLAVRKVKNSKLSAVTPSTNARYKMRLGSATQKLADATDVPTAPVVLVTALGSIVTSPASQATGLGIVATYSPVTATFEATVSTQTAVTAQFIANFRTAPAITALFKSEISFVTPVTASITIGILTAVTQFIATTAGSLTSATFSYITSATFSAPIDRSSNIFNYLAGSGGSLIYPRGKNPLYLTAQMNSPQAAVVCCGFSSGSVSTISIIARGQGYPIGNFKLVFSGGGATAGTVTATAEVSITNGGVDLITLSSGGSGYASAPIATLFTPDKSLLSILPTNALGEVNGKRQFFWVLGRTPGDSAPIRFTAPDTTSVVTFNTVPSASLVFVQGNTWEINIGNRGYGYVATPTVTHDAAPASTAKITFNRVVSSAGIGLLVQTISTAGLLFIRNGGIPLLPEFYFNPTIRQTNILNMNSRIGSGFTSWYGTTTASLYLINNTGNIPDLESLRLINELEQSNFAGREFFATVTVGSTNIGALVRASVPQINLDYDVEVRSFYGERIFDLQSKTISVVRPGDGKRVSGGGIWETSFEIMDYGDSYPNDLGGKLVGLLPLQTGSTILQSPIAQVVTIPLTVGNGYANTIISQSPTIATRPGKTSTETFINSGGFGFVDRGTLAEPIAQAFSGFSATVTTQTVTAGGLIISTTPGIVTTARILAFPKAYTPGTYDCEVASPVTGTKAQIQLIVTPTTASVVILDGGSGYTTAPVITAPAPNGRNGSVILLAPLNNPSGYTAGATVGLLFASSVATGGTAEGEFALKTSRYIYAAVASVSEKSYLTYQGVSTDPFSQLGVKNKYDPPLPANAKIVSRTGSKVVVANTSGTQSISEYIVTYLDYRITNSGFGYTVAPTVLAEAPSKSTGGQILSFNLANTPVGYNFGTNYDCSVATSPLDNGTAQLSFSLLKVNKTIFEDAGKKTIIEVPNPKDIKDTSSYSSFNQYDSTVLQNTYVPITKLRIVVLEDKYIGITHNSGFGYTTSPTITAPTPDSTDVGEIIGLKLTNTPVGYRQNNEYKLTIGESPSADGGATAKFSVSSLGVISAQVQNAGFGYVTKPVVTAASPDLDQGFLGGVSVSTLGRGFAPGSYICNVTDAPSGGQTAVVNFNTDDRGVGVFQISSVGRGYVTAPSISVPTPFGNIIKSITISCKGSFYEPQTALFSVNDSIGSGVSLGSPILSSGGIELIPVIVGGYGYSNIPAIQFSAPTEPIKNPLEASFVEGDFNITVASANAILSTSTQKDILMEVFETDGTNEQVVAQATVSLAKRVLE